MDLRFYFRLSFPLGVLQKLMTLILKSFQLDFVLENKNIFFWQKRFVSELSGTVNMPSPFLLPELKLPLSQHDIKAVTPSGNLEKDPFKGGPDGQQQYYK